MKRQFRVIQPDEKGYSGLTAVKLDNGNELVAMGVGPEVERRLLGEASRRK